MKNKWKKQFGHAMRPVGVCIPRTAASVNWRNTVRRHCSTYSRRCTACRCSPNTGHRLVSCSCHTVWTFCCVCTPLSLDSWLFYQVESWLKTMRLLLELVCFLMMLMFLSVLRTADARTVAVISVHSSSFWTGSTHSSSSSSTTVGSMPVGVWRHSYYRCPPLPI